MWETYPPAPILSPVVTPPRPQPDIDHYAVLGVADSAPHATIREAYRRAIRESHPDLVGAGVPTTAEAVALNAAWAVLKDPRRRADYDRARAQRRGASAPGDGNPAPDAEDLLPSWGPGGVRPVTVAQLREAAARESAYSAVGRAQREAFSAASRRIGVGILAVGVLVLMLLTATLR